MAEKLQLHVSGLNTLARCGIAFERRYIRGERTPRSPRLVIGSAVDRTVSADLTQKMDSGALMPDGDVQDLAHDCLVKEWESDEVVVTGQDREEGMTGSKADAIDASVSLSTLYHKKLAPKVQPTHVQRPWVLDVDGMAMPLQIAGTIDVQELVQIQEFGTPPESGLNRRQYASALRGNGLVRIRDTKTSGKSPNAKTADESLQLTTYALATLQIDGVMPAEVVLDYLVRTPKKHKLSLVQLRSSRTVDHLSHLMHRIEAAANILKQGTFSPAPPDSWWCSEKWCDFWPTCPYAARPVSVPTATEVGSGRL